MGAIIGAVAGVASAGAGIYGATQAGKGGAPDSYRTLNQLLSFRRNRGQAWNAQDASDAYFNQGLRSSLAEMSLFGSPGETINQRYWSTDYKGRGGRWVNRQVQVPQFEGSLALAARTQPYVASLQKQDLTNKIGLLKELAPSLYEAQKQYDPMRQALSDELVRTATQGLSSSPQNSSFADERDVLQSIRSGQAARGMGFGNTDLYREAIAVDRARQQRRLAEADLGFRRSELASRALSVRSATTPDPVQVLLGQMGNANSQSVVGQAMQGVGSPLSLNQQIAGMNPLAGNQAAYAMDQSGRNQMWNQLTSGLGGLSQSAFKLYNTPNPYYGTPAGDVPHSYTGDPSSPYRFR